MTRTIAGGPAAIAAFAAQLTRRRTVAPAPTKAARARAGGSSACAVRTVFALATVVLSGGLTSPAPAMQILEAVDHAELAAEASATGVTRIALAGDRIRRVIRSARGFAVEHDAESGDLWLRPVAPERVDGAPVTLFIGTERGFTYRLALIPVARAGAQILIRNGDAPPRGAEGAGGSDPRVAALVRLVRAVARREVLPGYAIEAGAGRSMDGLALIETWRGPRFAAHVLEADPGRGEGAGAPAAAALAGTIGARLADGGPLAEGTRLAALWLAPPGSGPSGGRLAVVVVETPGNGR